jgi:hypothetical protein
MSEGGSHIVSSKEVSPMAEQPSAEGREEGKVNVGTTTDKGFNEYSLSIQEDLVIDPTRLNPILVQMVNQLVATRDAVRAGGGASGTFSLFLKSVKVPF